MIRSGTLYLPLAKLPAMVPHIVGGDLFVNAVPSTHLIQVEDCHGEVFVVGGCPGPVIGSAIPS